MKSSGIVEGITLGRSLAAGTRISSTIAGEERFGQDLRFCASSLLDDLFAPEVDDGNTVGRGMHQRWTRLALYVVEDDAQVVRVLPDAD